MAADIALRNDDFIRAEQYVHQAIANKSKDTNSLWKDEIASGDFEYGRGYMMKKHSFFGGKELTDVSGDWYQLKAYADRTDGAAGGDGTQMEDSCQYNPPVVGYGFEEKKYTIYETSRRTEDICLRDLVYNWQFEKQAEMIFNNLADITLSAWEKWLRETYVTFATKQLVAEGFPTFTITNGGITDSVLTNAGLRTINLGGTPADSIALLTQDVLDYKYHYLSRQAKTGACATSDGGMPVFCLVTSYETSTDVIRRDTMRNEEMRYAKPSFLLEGYGTLKGYQNWAHYHDMEVPRYKLSQDGATLERVYPFEFTPTTIGEATNISEDYVTAPFEMSIIFLKNVFRGLVPENPTNVAGATFGGASNLGTFKWINIQNKDTNLLGEIGFMFARFNCAPEPLDHVDNALVLLHRRHQAVPVMMPLQSTDHDLAADTALAVLSVEAKITPDDTADDEYQEAEILMDGSVAVPNVNVGDTGVLTGTATSAVNVTGATTGAKTVRVTRDYASGRIRVMFGGEADWATAIQSDIDGAGITFNNS